MLDVINVDQKRFLVAKTEVLHPIILSANGAYNYIYCTAFCEVDGVLYKEFRGTVILKNVLFVFN